MIEIIQEQSWDSPQERRGLPKNIKQIGTADVGDRIYIENKAYQIMHPYGNCRDKTVYVMMGRFEDYGGGACVFIETAVEMSEVPFNGNLPVWNDESWAALYRKLRPEHENMIIVGWAVDICGQLPNMTAQLEHVHQSYFGGVHQVLFLMDSVEGEENFYSNRCGYLKRRTGFYVYYDRITLNVLEQQEKREAVKTQWEESERERSYREYLNSRDRKRVSARGSRRQPAPNQPSYMPTFFLLLVIAGLGYFSLKSYVKMDEMQQTLNKMNGVQAVMQTESVDTDVIRVEEIVGSVSAGQQAMGSVADAATETTAAQTVTQIQTETQTVTETQMQATQAQETSSKAVSESEKYLSQGYYIVQTGDSLAAISRKIYHTAAMMDELCELNEIENANAIYAGQYLELPK